MNLMLAALALASSAASQEAALVSPGSTWALARDTCTLNGGWGGEAEPAFLFVEPVADHYHVSILTTDMTEVRPGDPARLDIGIDGIVGRTGLLASGYEGEDSYRGYVIEADDDILRRLAFEGTMELYRDGRELISLPMRGSAEAIAALRACVTAMPVPTAEIGGDETWDAEAADDALARAEAALDAVMETMTEPGPE